MRQCQDIDQDWGICSSIVLKLEIAFYDLKQALINNNNNNNNNNNIFYYYYYLLLLLLLLYQWIFWQKYQWWKLLKIYKNVWKNF